jgi:hypothetical protein
MSIVFIERYRGRVEVAQKLGIGKKELLVLLDIRRMRR